MKENKGSSSIILLIVSIIILICAAVFFMYANGMFDKKGEPKQSNNNLSQTNNNKRNVENDYDYDYDEDDNEDEDEDDYDFEEEEEYVSNEIMGPWFGKYVDSNGNQILIYRGSRSRLNVDITAESEDGFSSSYEVGGVEVDSTEKITYESSDFEEKTILELELNDNNLIVKASSNEEGSLLNSIDGTYEKEEVQTSGWNGIYANDDHEIILSEDYRDNIIVMIDSFWQRFADDFDENKIEYEEEFFDDTEIFKIEKTENGIKITESSSTAEDDILNEVNGLEFKKMN